MTKPKAKSTHNLGLCSCGRPAILKRSQDAICERCNTIERVLYPRRADVTFVQRKRFTKGFA